MPVATACEVVFTVEYARRRLCRPRSMLVGIAEVRDRRFFGTDCALSGNPSRPFRAVAVEKTRGVASRALGEVDDLFRHESHTYFDVRNGVARF